MKKRTSIILAYTSKKISEMNVNSACMWFVYQPIVPEHVRNKCKK